MSWVRINDRWEISEDLSELYDRSTDLCCPKVGKRYDGLHKLVYEYQHPLGATLLIPVCIMSSCRGIHYLNPFGHLILDLHVYEEVTRLMEVR